MARQQSSIKGQGARIVGGESEPQPTEPTSTQTEAAAAGAPTGATGDAAPVPPPESPPPSMAELEAALYEEARAGEPEPVEEKAPWDDESAWPPSPEMEEELLQEDEAEGEELPVVEVPVAPEVEGEETVDLRAEAATFRAVKVDDEEDEQTPGVEESMEETELIDDVLLDEPEIYDTEDVLPPKAPPGGFEMAEMEALGSGEIMDFGEKVEPLELPDRPLPAEGAIEVRDLAAARIQILDEEISQVYDQVRTEVGASESIVNQCYNLLLKARDVVLRRELTRIPQAEYYVEQARARLSRAAASRRGAGRHAWWIMLWGLIWAMVYVALLLVVGSEYVTGWINYLGLRSAFVDPSILLMAMVSGGIGGVVAIWWHLFKHVSQRDFDSSYNISYLGKPFFGPILGAMAYMVVLVFVASLGIRPNAEAAGAGGVGDPTLTPWIIYVTALACGFKENRIFGMVDRLMKSIFSRS